MKPILRLFCFSLMLLVMFSCTSRKEKPGPKPAVPVKTAQAVQKTVPVQIRAIGTVNRSVQWR